MNKKVDTHIHMVDLVVTEKQLIIFDLESKIVAPECEWKFPCVIQCTFAPFVNKKFLVEPLYFVKNGDPLWIQVTIDLTSKGIILNYCFKECSTFLAEEAIACLLTETNPQVNMRKYLDKDLLKNPLSHLWALFENDDQCLGWKSLSNIFRENVMVSPRHQKKKNVEEEQYVASSSVSEEEQEIYVSESDKEFIPSGRLGKRELDYNDEIVHEKKKLILDKDVLNTKTRNWEMKEQQQTNPELISVFQSSFRNDKTLFVDHNERLVSMPVTEDHANIKAYELPVFVPNQTLMQDFAKEFFEKWGKHNFSVICYPGILIARKNFAYSQVQRQDSKHYYENAFGTELSIVEGNCYARGPTTILENGQPISFEVMVGISCPKTSAMKVTVGFKQVGSKTQYKTRARPAVCQILDMLDHLKETQKNTIMQHPLMNFWVLVREPLLEKNFWIPLNCLIPFFLRAPVSKKRSFLISKQIKINCL